MNPAINHPNELTLLDIFIEILVDDSLRKCKSEQDFTKEMLKLKSETEIKALKKMVARHYPQFQKKFDQLTAFQ